MSAIEDGTAPTRIGPYLIRRKIADGAASEVYEAVNEQTSVPVALKILSRDMTGDADAVERIAREAGVLRKVKHPNIIALLDHGAAEDGRPWLAFEYIHGATLQQILDRRVKPDWATGLAWMQDAAGALREAWKHHIIHRDVKPANMIIQRDLTLRLGDFGLAKEIHNPEQAGDRALVGSPRYISPEMAAGLSLDFRADMYSLGACFYHYFTGQAPFEAPSARELLRMHASAPLVPPYAVEPSLPQDICDIIEHLMRKDPAERYQDYDDLESDLREASLALQAAGGQRVDFDMTAIIGKPPFALEPTEREKAAGARMVSGRTTAEIESTRPVDHPRPRINPMEVDPMNPPGEDPGVALVARREAARARIKIMLALAALALVAVFSLTPGLMNDSSGGKGWLARRLSTLFGGDRSGGALVENAITENRLRMEAVMSMLVRYEVAHKGFPPTLEAAAKEAGEAAAPLADAWGTPFIYDFGRRTVRSCGMDLKAESPDDFVINEKLVFTALPDPSTTFGPVRK